MSVRTKAELVVVFLLIAVSGLWVRSCENEAEARGEADAARSERQEAVRTAASAEVARRQEVGAWQQEAADQQRRGDSAVAKAQRIEADRRVALDRADQAAQRAPGAATAVRAAAGDSVATSAALDNLLGIQAQETNALRAAITQGEQKAAQFELALAHADSALAAKDHELLLERTARSTAQVALEAALKEIAVLRQAGPSRLHRVVEVALPVLAAYGGYRVGRAIDVKVVRVSAP